MMDTCCRCNRPLGMYSVIPVLIKGNMVKVAHFWCGTRGEVSSLYGKKTTALARMTQEA